MEWHNRAVELDARADSYAHRPIFQRSLRTMATACRSAVVANYLEQETGLPHCSCCLLPRMLHPVEGCTG